MNAQLARNPAQLLRNGSISARLLTVGRSTWRRRCCRNSPTLHAPVRRRWLCTYVSCGGLARRSISV
eukprot:scaffold1201_cov413-Prasinococcus_capsulatus_cf.AAC.12